jgi:hypothetical protein
MRVITIFPSTTCTARRSRRQALMPFRPLRTLLASLAGSPSGSRIMLSPSLSFATRSPRLPHFDLPFLIVSRRRFSIRGPHGPQVVDDVHRFEEKQSLSQRPREQRYFVGWCARLVMGRRTENAGLDSKQVQGLAFTATSGSIPLPFSAKRAKNSGTLKDLPNSMLDVRMLDVRRKLTFQPWPSGC